MLKFNYRKFAQIFKRKNCKNYEVLIIEEYDRQLFWHVRHIKTSKCLPFKFKTLEIAQDFCEYLPEDIEKEKVKLYIDEHQSFWRNYHTYKFKIGDQTVYIKWENVKGKASVWKSTFSSNDFVVDKFVRQIRLGNKQPLSDDPHTSFEFDCEYDTLSEYMNHMGILKDEEMYTYELIDA